MTFGRARRALVNRLRRACEAQSMRAARRLGYHLVPRHFYSPIPIIEELPSGLWAGPATWLGVDSRADTAMAFLGGALKPYLIEFDAPLEDSGGGGFWLHNGGYESVDAETLYAMVRYLKPALVYELGSGGSSHVIHLAARANAGEDRPVHHVIFDPFPYDVGTMGPVDGAEVHAVRTEDIDPERFRALQAGDILFVDTTHTVRTGGDVTHIILNVLPRLAVGVTVHFHDIFLPYEYPEDWVVDRRRAWAEQYLLQAFLAFNDVFEVVLPNYAVSRSAPDTLRGLIPSFNDTVRPGGFWIRRKPLRPGSAS